MGKNVLLIADDDEMNRMIIRKFLNKDYDIVEAENGKVAMGILQSQHVDAVLLDIIMPEMDGLEVLEDMRKEEKFANIGVLVATSTKEKTEREALTLGADDVVAKPYDPVVIKKRMQNVLAMKAIEKQQKMIENGDTISLLTQQSDEMRGKMEVSVNKIIKFADIIRANKSNFKLVNEVVDEIQIEARGALNSVKGEE